MAYSNRESNYKRNANNAKEANIIAEVSRLSEIYNSLYNECAAIKREMRYLAAQNEQIFNALSQKMQQLTVAKSGGIVVTPQTEQTAQPARIDYDELATKIAGLFPAQEYIPPDYIASKVAEQLAVNGMPDSSNAVAGAVAPVAVPADQKIDVDDLADRIALKVGGIKADDFDILVDDYGCQSISDAIVQRLDYDVISSAIAQKLRVELAGPTDGDLSTTENIDDVEKIRQITEPRFDRIDEHISEIKAMLMGGVALQATEDSDLVTVSDVTEDQENCEESDDEFDELVEEIDEAPSEGEIMVAKLDADDGVDFENMMKYNRSFIARIIQSSDEHKEYYGRVKTALLSYAKVNSNLAWGAERFNKGRETIARFKIRGKTLCLYLALNPTEYRYSVYHHIDVSGNQSMNGTPMMIKIKSPRGVKKAIRLIDDMLEQRGGIKRAKSFERNYAAMYPYESIEELIEDGLVKDVSNNK